MVGEFRQARHSVGAVALDEHVAGRRVDGQQRAVLAVSVLGRGRRGHLEHENS